MAAEAVPRFNLRPASLGFSILSIDQLIVRFNEFKQRYVKNVFVDYFKPSKINKAISI